MRGGCELREDIVDGHPGLQRHKHRFVFIRHAQAQCNLQHAGAQIESADPESPLTGGGEAQAQRLAAALPDELTGSQIFSSPMRRAVQTAHVLAQRRGLPIVLDDRLEEVRLARPLLPPLSVADWDAMLEERLKRPGQQAKAGVETVLEQMGRVESFLRDRHASRGDEKLTLVVSHAFTIELAILRLLGWAPAEGPASSRVRISNAALHVIENETLGGSTRLMLVNAKNHLGTLL